MLESSDTSTGMLYTFVTNLREDPGVLESSDTSTGMLYTFVTTSGRIQVCSRAT